MKNFKPTAIVLTVVIYLVALFIIFTTDSLKTSLITGIIAILLMFWIFKKCSKATYLLTIKDNKGEVIDTVEVEATSPDEAAQRYIRNRIENIKSEEDFPKFLDVTVSRKK